MANNESSATGIVYLDTSAAQLALSRLNSKIKDYDEELGKANTTQGRRITLETNRATAAKKAIEVEQQLAKGLGVTYNQQKDLVFSLLGQLKKLPINTQEYIDKLKQLKIAEGVFDEMKDKIAGVDQATKQIGGGLTKVGAFFATFFANLATKAVSALTSAGAAVFNLNIQFEKSVANLSAITGATGQDLDFLKNAAVELSTKGASSAVDFVEALKLVASAKPELLNAKEDLVAVTKAADLLSKASGISLPEAATKLTDALNQFGAPASDAAKYVDALAAASKYGAAEVPQVTDALLQFGAVAKSSNINIYESAGAIELLAEKGIKGAEAGTKLRNIFLRMSATEALPKEAVEALRQAGVNTEILQDKTKTLEERLKEFSKIQNNANALAKVFGEVNVVAGQIVLQNVPRYAQLTSQVKEQGVAAKQAATNTNTLEFAWQRFKNVLAAKFLSGTNDFLKGLVQSVTSLVDPTNTATARFKELSATVNHLEKDIVPLVARYDELKRYTVLNKDEQVELKNIIAQITEIMPGAINAQDQYGNAIGINTDRVRDYIEVQKTRKRLENGNAIEEQKRNLEDNKLALRIVEDKIRQINKTGTFKVNEVDGVNVGAVAVREANEDEIRRAQEKYRELILERKVYYENLDDLTGKNLEKNIKRQQEAAKKLKEKQDAAAAANTNTNNNAESPEAKAKRESAQKKSDEERARLLNEYNNFIKGINQAVNDLLTPEASKKFIGILKEAQNEVEKINEVKRKGAVNELQLQETLLKINEKKSIAIRELLADEEKAFKAPINQSSIKASDLPAQLKNRLENQPPVEVNVPVDILPKIEAVDEKAISTAIAKVLDKLQKEQEAVSKLRLLKAKKNPNDRRTAQLLDLEDEYADTFKNIERQRAAILMGKRKEVDNVLLLQEGEYLQKKKQINKEALDAILADISLYLEFANQVLDVLATFNQARENKENAALKKELSGNEAKKASYKKQLDQKLISQQRYNQLVHKLDQDAEKKKDELAKKQFERNKKFQLAQAFISGAQAVLKTIETFGPPFPPNFLAIGAMALTIGSTIASIAAITSAKYAMGGKVEQLGNGKITATPNAPTQPGGDNVLAMVKPGEVILNEDQQRRAGGAGFFKALGVPGFANGGRVKPFWETRPYVSLNYPAIVKSQKIVHHYAAGGLIANQRTQEANQTGPMTIETISSAEQKQLLEAIIFRLDNPVAPNVEISLKAINEKQAQLDRIKKSAGG